MGIRIPLIRRGEDATPVAWWEYIFLPLVAIVLTSAFVIGFVVSIPWSFFHKRAIQNKSRSTHAHFKAADRFMADETLVEHLLHGRGTLIVLRLSPKEPYREFWTSDDLIAMAPESLPGLATSHQSESLTQFATVCIERYLDSTTGTAFLTHGRLSTHDLSVSARFPKARIVTILTTLGDPIIVLGHLEAARRAG